MSDSISTWSTARPDWQSRIKLGQSLLPDLPLNKDEAEAAVAIFSKLRLPDVIGQPPFRDVAGQWQKDLVRAVFGSYDPEVNERHIREFFCMIAKKSGKTTCSAAVMICAVLMNRRPRAEFLLIAPTLEVADLAFRQAVGMIESDPILTGKFHIRDHLKTIVYRPTKAFLKVKSFDPRVVTGSKPCGVLVDELHAISGAHDADRVMGQLRGGLIANPEAFLISITTQSERPPSGVFKEALHSARRVRDGEITLPLLPLIYEFPREVDWRDTANWRMVNPTLTVAIDRLIPDYEAAVSAGDHELRRWASQHLNVEIGLGLQTDRWPGAEFWERQTDRSLTLEALLDRSEVVVCGMDGGGLDDLFGFAVLGRDADGRDKASKSWLLWSHAWCHRSVLDRRQQIAPRLLDFAKAGELTICDDVLDDLEAMKQIISDIKARGLLAHVAVDPAGVGDIVDAMAAIGVTEENKILWPVGQGYRLMNSLKTCERRLAKQTLWHSENSMMSWCVSNLKIEPTATAIRATRTNAGDQKIDAAMAMFDAADVMALGPEPTRVPEFEVIFAAVGWICWIVGTVLIGTLSSAI